jgi:hypothetical protein
LFYVAYMSATRLTEQHDTRRLAFLMFLLTPALALPVDVTALQFHWWWYPSGSRAFLNGVPYFVPLAWGISGALFYWFMQRVRRIPLRGNGQLFALVAAVPLVAGVDVLLIGLGQLLIAGLALVPGDVLLNASLAILLLLLPLLSLIGIPPLEKRRS